MRLNPPQLHRVLLVSSLFFPTALYADGLADLHQALDSLTGTTAISATLTNRFTEKRGEGKDLKEQQGAADILLSDEGAGLQITYGNDVLYAMEEEARLKLEDEDAPTPTRDAVNNLEASELKTILSAATNLKRFVQKASFREEEEQQCDAGRVRILTFDLPLEAVISNKKVRDYVNDFDGQYHLWIDEQGFPLKSRLSFAGDGRAFIFFTMQAESQRTTHYEVIGDRLVVMDRAYHSAYDSSWDKSETRGNETLVLHHPAPTPEKGLLAQCNVPAADTIKS
ncbi:hypothetical protein [Lacimicrobium sp. SS2-24]|uniref:hypothetical protein n=1 Tax=Lacimicrobium sp. SS2-24 TaxID=2005569 RepID=UPI000B4AC0B4|nr:hypothetical protein [Lacimicrobium sp. SS2-24]